MELIMPQPCTSNPTEKPAAPSKAPVRLDRILAPTAGPTQAERLLPETKHHSQENQNYKKNFQYHLAIT